MFNLPGMLIGWVPLVIAAAIATASITYAETEALLRIAINMRGHTVKAIADATGIRADTLYKWKTTEGHAYSPPCSEQ